MLVRKVDLTDHDNPIIHLEAETVEEKQLFHIIWFRACELEIVSYNGYEKLAITTSKKEIVK